jgi:hypothetical protein
MVPMMTKGEYATYSLEVSLPVNMQARQWMGTRLMMKE